MYTMGIDIGSTASKGLILKNSKEIVAKHIVPIGTGTSGPAKVLDELFKLSRLSEQDITRTIVTGYGRMKFDNADKQLTEISCHAKGVFHLTPTAGTIIDIGGQDIKVLNINSRGRILNFVMNDKCAAGTGRFLDVMANVLEVKVSDLSLLSSKSNKEVNISSTCTVFAESEVISHLSAGVDIADIIAGIHRSVARKVAGLVHRIGLQTDVVMTGGVAQNYGVVRALEKELDVSINVNEIAQLTGALGAALFAWEEINS